MRARVAQLSVGQLPTFHIVSEKLSQLYCNVERNSFRIKYLYCKIVVLMRNTDDKSPLNFANV